MLKTARQMPRGKREPFPVARLPGYVECEVKDEQDRLVARVSCTCLKIRKD
jgi:hypothetical protein